MQSSRGAHNLKGTIASERDRNASGEDVDEEEEEEAPPRYFKGNQVKNVLNPPEESKHVERIGVIEPDFNERRLSVRYKNYGCSSVVRNAHSDKINCLCFILNGAFLTGSSDKTIKCWYPLE